MNPLISIVLPTYNRAHTLRNSVESLLAQTYQNFEIIIVDDGSEDKTKQLVDDLRKKDPRIQYIRHSFRKGANAARNKGVLEAKGEYIAFQDSDDEWLPDKLSVQMRAIRNTGLQAAFTSFWRIKGNKRTYIPKKHRHIKPGVRSFNKELLEGNFITLPTFIVEKSLFHQAGGFDEQLPRLQDWELVLRLSKLTDFIYIDQPLVNAYLGNDSITAKKKLYREAMELIINKHRNDFEASPIAFVIQNLNLAINCIENYKYKQAVINLNMAFNLGITPVFGLAIQTLLSRIRRE